MYTPRAFEQPDRDAWEALVREYPLATLVVQLPDGMEATHVPLVFEGETLHGHVARGNPIASAAGARALVVFSGPEHYISPSTYPSKADDPRVVPTWNYIAVHMHGTLATFTDAERLLHLVTDLTQRHERVRPEPWQVNDAPAEFIARLLNGITGIEIRVDRVEAKWKVSQNRAEADRQGAADGLGDHPMARAIREAL